MVLSIIILGGLIWFLSQRICKNSLSGITRRLSIHFNKGWVYITINAGKVLALGELYPRETLGVFTYSWGKPKFGKFIIKFDRNFKNSSVFLT